MTNNSSFAVMPARKGHSDALKDTIEGEVWLLNDIAHAAQKVWTPSTLQQFFWIKNYFSDLKISWCPTWAWEFKKKNNV